MKEYPSIPTKHYYAPSIIAFDKLDGSNIRAEWTKKNGFSKFGRRNGLLDDSNPILKESVPLIQSKYEQKLTEIFLKERYTKVTCFFEFFGPNSFAGLHDGKDMNVVLIDVSVHPKGFLSPQEFIKQFGGVEIPKILHIGKWNKELTDQVNNGTLPNMTFEGVVCKGPPLSPGQNFMFKVKNFAWYKKLKEKCGDNEKLFNELA